jgi:Uncharacterized protein involved in cytokinesis, contains TGc (transglutaminase/protease-like) domain
MKIFILLPLIFSTHQLFAQATKSNFSSIDKRAKPIQANPVGPLSKKLTSPYKTQLEKVRSIFRWITENIQYDVEGYHNPKGVYSDLFRSAISSVDSVRQADYNNSIIQKVLTERKAVCEGYARLFKTLCDSANIPCVTISGHVRWYTDPIGIITDRKHSWNAVFLNNKWQLLDPTWASGKVDDKTKKFQKEYDDFYFLTDPIQFYNDHCPADAKWALFANPPSRQQFYKYPFFHPEFYKSRITSVKPTNGLIEVTANQKTIRIELESLVKQKELLVIEYPDQNDTINYAQDDSLLIEELNKKYASQYEIDGNKIYWDYEIKSIKTERLDIYFVDKLILTYSVRFRK